MNTWKILRKFLVIMKKLNIIWFKWTKVVNFKLIAKDFRTNIIPISSAYIKFKEFKRGLCLQSTVRLNKITLEILKFLFRFFCALMIVRCFVIYLRKRMLTNKPKRILHHDFQLEFTNCTFRKPSPGLSFISLNCSHVYDFTSVFLLLQKSS